MSTWMDTPSTSSPENSSSSSSSTLRGLASNATVAVAMAMNHSSPAAAGGGSSVEMSARFNPSMAIIIVVLLGTFFFMGVLSIYVKKCVTTEADLEHNIPIASWTMDHNPRWTSQRSMPAALLHIHQQQQQQQQQIQIQRQLGLDKAAIQALPIVLKPSLKNPSAPNECCVCLGEFQEQEFVRLLPRCGHSFHVECIDLWLLAHSTCPLCRFKLTPDNVHTAVIDVSVPAPAQQQQQQQGSIEALHNPSPQPRRDGRGGIRSIVARVWEFQRRGRDSGNSASDRDRDPDGAPQRQQQQQHRQDENQEQQQWRQLDDDDAHHHQEISVSSDVLESEQGGIEQQQQQNRDQQQQAQECGDQEPQEHHNLAALLLLRKVWSVFKSWKVGRLIGGGRIFGSS